MAKLFFQIKDNMKGNGNIIKLMEKENLNGPMEVFMKENIKMIKKMDLVYLNGLMEEFIKEIGKMGNKMVKENFFHLKYKNGKKVSGKTAKELFGIIKRLYKLNISIIFIKC